MTPAGQRWTRSKPTAPGWYWWRSDRHVHIEVVKVHVSAGILCIADAGFDAALYTTGEWQGPLTPNEATE